MEGRPVPSLSPLCGVRAYVRSIERIKFIFCQLNLSPGRPRSRVYNIYMAPGTHKARNLPKIINLNTRGKSYDVRRSMGPSRNQTM